MKKGRKTLVYLDSNLRNTYLCSRFQLENFDYQYFADIGNGPV